MKYPGITVEFNRTKKMRKEEGLFFSIPEDVISDIPTRKYGSTYK